MLEVRLDFWVEAKAETLMWEESSKAMATCISRLSTWAEYVRFEGTVRGRASILEAYWKLQEASDSLEIWTSAGGPRRGNNLSCEKLDAGGSLKARPVITWGLGWGQP